MTLPEPLSDEDLELCREMVSGAPVNVTMALFISTTDRLRKERDAVQWCQKACSHMDQIYALERERDDLKKKLAAALFG